MIVQRLARLADNVILSSGWSRRGIAFAAGAFGVLALPPFGVFPFLVVTMTIAVWLIDGTAGQTFSPIRSRLSAAWEAAKIGWWLGFGYFLAGFWWLGAAFLVEADVFAWALPLGVMGLPAALAIFVALGFGLARCIWSSGFGRVLALSAGLGFSEWLRSVILTGFPWNNFGMALGGNLVFAQSASLVGLHGLTILSVLLAASPALLADRNRPLRAMTAAASLLVILAGFGSMRLALSETSFEPDVNLRIMQPNLRQDEKFRPEAMPEVLSKYLELSGSVTHARPNGVGDVTHLIWPESPFPVVLSRDADALRRIGDFLAPNVTLITGAVRIEASDAGRPPNYFNSVQVLRPGGVIVDSYDKRHLVPFGEYLPFRAVFDALKIRQFVHIPGGFEAGAAKNLLRPPGFPAIAPLICYEAIFPGYAVPPNGRTAGAAVLLNVTNDGWFGNTPGPRQHFAQARLRAIEEGLPLVRAANTGVSAIVDPYGRVIASLPVGVEGVLDGKLPRAGPVTIISARPFLLPAVLWFFVFLGAIAFRGGRARKVK